MLVAKCISNTVGNPSYTLDKKYKITDKGMSSNFFSNELIDQWNGQFSNEPKPTLEVGITFKRNGCKFIIEEED